MNPTVKTSTLLELHVPNFKLARDFYTKLGFVIVRDETLKDKYLVMKMKDNIICFWGGDQRIFQHGYFKDFDPNSKRGYGLEIVIMVDDLEKYYQKVKQFAK